MSTMAVIVVIQVVSFLLIGAFLLFIINHFSKFTFVNIRKVLPGIGIFAVAVVLVSWFMQGGQGLSYFLLPLIIIGILFVMIKKAPAR
ncbi:hypothetical protein EPH95_12555 [Salicibibacter halophilus]|uniref:Uncharacterized protein n=1 Tax=Salicibibacter halophilus TaxID=2502791 RepID=A0A514LK40_9BACI|nr:hypothetical protein [Salicibibacter halophilus]QDI91905.1 hypothetical protein EPH95_12555 [Salicibibacter halophilus]